MKNLYNIDYLIDLVKKTFDIISVSSKKEVYKKIDGSIVTEADLSVETFIYERLMKIDKNILIISEEKKFQEYHFLENKYWIIDPIDGTRGFKDGGNEFTVNLALILKGVPVLGIIGHPPSKKIWYAFDGKSYLLNNNKKIYLNPSKSKRKKPRLICSRGFNNKISNHLSNNLFCIEKISSSLKFCRIAEGLADIYPRIEPINKWDIAAGDAIVRGMGGVTVDEKGKVFNYLSSGPSTGKFFVIANNYYKDFLVKFNC